ncbi:HAD family hydrolase [Pseudoflavonifractor sp. HCP28S3_F10]|uniref:HAD family hydrolase n=1 Tax=Pseudoflavonifractor sp. HCP28S3_F10 TaxID=3438947 RepID=UPI003F8AF895
MLLFDLDGTLIDSNGVWVKVDDQFLSRRGLTATPEYCHMVGHSIFPVAAQFTKDYYHLPERPEDIMAEWMNLAGDAYANHVPLKPGAAEFLARCAAAGERMVLVTACVPQLCRAALARHGLSNAFSPIIFAQELGIEKRDPRFFQTVLERLGAAPEDCTLFEDSPGACKTAREAGIRVVGVYDAFYDAWQDDLKANCHRYIRGFDELLD